MDFVYNVAYGFSRWWLYQAKRQFIITDAELPVQAMKVNYYEVQSRFFGGSPCVLRLQLKTCTYYYHISPIASN